jgi:hypothetical protein
MRFIPRSIFLKAEAVQDRLVRASFNKKAAATAECSHRSTQVPATNPIRTTILPNGLTILTESMPHVRSVTTAV